ncbi:hypothetical protein ABT143_23890 [Streptomyces sp. NPDC002033]|uniref:hypothetical protein n=1 Tax=unclassified Streptomyces TaxID=2593676 RepID=UPI003326D311
MVQVSVTAAVKVAGGPSLPLSLSLDPKSYTLSSVSLAKAGDTTGEDRDTEKVPLPAGTMVLLAMKVTSTATGKPAQVEAELMTGKTITVSDSLLIASASLLTHLLPVTGKREVTLTNTGEAVTVEILTCRTA